MTKEERLALAQQLMQKEARGLWEEVQALGNLVLDEVFRLEKTGEIAEAKAFEAFLPVDEAFLVSLLPLLGQEEYEKTLALYKEEKTKQRLAYLGDFLL